LKQPQHRKEKGKSMNANNEYLLLFSGTEWYSRLSPVEIQKVIDQSKTWFEELAAAGQAKSGQALAREGAVISGKNPRVIFDGPFPELKEAIGGFMVLEAGSLSEAVAIAKTNPALLHGTTIEVRPLSDQCPLNVRAKELGCGEKLAQAAA
jgi:hypothetical protein